nr:hypothetical protein [Tanacetum cinerariifolium]
MPCCGGCDGGETEVGVAARGCGDGIIVGVDGGGKEAAKVVVVLRRWLAEEVMMVSAVKRGAAGDAGWCSGEPAGWRRVTATWKGE